MSHHHMLTPIVYVATVKPKKIEPRRSRIQMRAAGSAVGAGEGEDVFEAAGPGLSLPAGPGLPPQNFVPVEGAEQKPQHPQGRLSEGTLKVMLQVQESKEGFA